jgi:hypothetical protein
MAFSTLLIASVDIAFPWCGVSVRQFSVDIIPALPKEHPNTPQDNPYKKEKVFAVFAGKS